MVDDVPEIDGTLVVQIKGIEILPKIVPAKRLGHASHSLPMHLADRVAVLLNLSLGPQMQFPTWQDVIHVAKRTLPATRGEDGVCAIRRVRVEAKWKIVLDVIHRYLVSARTVHAVFFR